MPRNLDIRVVSFNFEGCLFHSNYENQYVNKANGVIDANSNLLRQIKHKNENFEKTFTFIGSEQQSMQDDQHYAQTLSSCFSAIEEVSVFLGAKFDHFLLADIYGDLPAGTSFNRAMAHDKKPQEHANWKLDKSKATILYGQMHKIASQFMTKYIVFEFYDSSTNNPEFEILKRFFSQYPELIPANVTLRLRSYAGDVVTTLETISGTGAIDLNYRQTIKDMATEAEKFCVAQPSHSLNTALYVKPGVLKNRLEISPTMIDYAMQFTEQLDVIKEKAIELSKRGHYMAAKKANALADQLAIKLKKYAYGEMDKESFQFQCKNLINNDARPILERHRGWKEIIGNLLLFVMTAGVGYMIGIAANRIINGHYLPRFFKTESVKPLEEIEKIVNDIVPVR